MVIIPSCPSCGHKNIECGKEQKVSNDILKTLTDRNIHATDQLMVCHEYECMNCECTWIETIVKDITKHGKLWYQR